MRKISCCAVPLKISGSVIGFLCVNTNQNSEKDKLKTIIDILSNAMINKLHLLECRKYKKRLSSQQLQILSLLANGKTESEIAEKLNYSIQTIKYHKRKIFDKFEVDNTRTAITKLYKYNDSKCLYK
jgi:DNA-binding NarL/FixJ family response regulator